jgi:hypothetical protein
MYLIFLDNKRLLQAWRRACLKAGIKLEVVKYLLAKQWKLLIMIMVITPVLTGNSAIFQMFCNAPGKSLKISEKNLAKPV